MLENHPTTPNKAVQHTRYLDQLQLEELLFKNNITKRLHTEFSHSEKLMDIIRDNKINEAFGINFLVQVCIRKQTLPSVIIGALLPYAKNNLELCIKWAEECIKADLADFNELHGTISMIWDVSKFVYEEIALLQYELPMVMPPQEVVSNLDTGYLTVRKFIVTNRKADKLDYNLDVINLLNKIPLHINYDVAIGIENTWKNCCQKPGESYDVYLKKLKALKRYNEHAEDILAHYKENDFIAYLTHFYDKRGRIYSAGYYINPQGNCWNKAMIWFAPEQLTS